jgi:hypothetical protein
MRYAQRCRQDRDGGAVAIATWLRGRRRCMAISPRPVAAGATGRHNMAFRADQGRPALKPALGLSGPLPSRLRGLRVQGFSATGACLLWAWFRRGLRPQGSARVAAPRSSANAHEDDGPDGRMREGKRHLCRPAERPTQRRSGREAMGSGLRCSWGPEAGWTFIANARMSWGGARLTALESGATRTVATVTALRPTGGSGQRPARWSKDGRVDRIDSWLLDRHRPSSAAIRVRLLRIDQR